MLPTLLLWMQITVYTTLLFVHFHFTVSNVLKARFALDLNVKEVCIKVGFLIKCEEASHNRCSGGCSRLARKIANNRLDWSPLHNVEASECASSVLSTSVLRERVSKGISKWCAVSSPAISFGSCCFCEPVLALSIWDIFVIYSSSLNVLSRVADIVF